MIPMWQTAEGIWEPVPGDPILTRLDGELRAPLSVVCADSWTWPERWEWGIHELEQGTIPEGFYSAHVTYRLDPDNIVREEHVLEPLPPPKVRPRPGRTIELTRARVPPPSSE